MTSEQALEELLRMVYRNTDDFETKLSKDCYNTIVRSLKKQIPEKPIITIHKYIDGDTKEQGEYKLKHCPNCWKNSDIGYFESLVDKNVPYCRRCGQALDWSETE